MTPGRPDGEEVPAELRARIAGDPWGATLGIELLALAPGYCRAAMRLGPAMRNFHGDPHGGAIFSLADYAFAAACNAHGEPAVALTVTVQYLVAAPPGARLIAQMWGRSLLRPDLDLEWDYRTAERLGLEWREPIPAADMRSLLTAHGIRWIGLTGNGSRETSSGALTSSATGSGTFRSHAVQLQIVQHIASAQPRARRQPGRDTGCGETVPAGGVRIGELQVLDR